MTSKTATAILETLFHQHALAMAAKDMQKAKHALFAARCLQALADEPEGNA